jgi:coenzyme F420 hydrogenase subunit beta
MTKLSIEAAVSNGLCTGCGLCAGVAPSGAIEMRLNKSGYMRPEFIKKTSQEFRGLMDNSCPALVVRHKKAEVPVHRIWGPLKQSRTGYSNDEDIRRCGSSGGVVTGLAWYLLKTKQVEFIAQIAVSSNNPLTNSIQISRTRDELLHAAGSRYAPSAPLASLKALIDSGQRFAFVGKPCDVAALRQYMRNDVIAQRQIPFLISFMCAGVPSQKGTDEVVRQLGFQPDEISEFRYRGNGWPGMTKATTVDGRTNEMDYGSSWGTILNRHLQFRCKICPDGTGEFADVVCADAWYGKDGYPDFAERDGRSLILTRTSVGESLVTEACVDGAIATEDLDVDEIERMQPYQVNRKKMVLGRLIATWLSKRHAPKYYNMGIFRASLAAKPVEWLRNAAGTYKRAAKENG